MNRLLFLFIAFGVCGWQSACLGSVPPPVFPRSFTGGGFPLASITLEGPQMALAGLGVVALLLGYHFLFGQYIRQQAGVKDTQSTTLEGQPIEVKAMTLFVEQRHLDERLSGYVTSEDLHAVEQRIDGKIETNFRELDKKRSHSIGNLHEHLTGTAVKLHERLEATAAGQRTELDTKIESVRREIHEMPGKLIALLKDTGAIGGKKA